MKDMAEDQEAFGRLIRDLLQSLDLAENLADGQSEETEETTEEDPLGGEAEAESEDDGAEGGEQEQDQDQTEGEAGESRPAPPSCPIATSSRATPKIPR